MAGILTIINVIAAQPVLAQFASGLPNAAGNQPIQGTASPSLAVTGIQGNPNANPSGISAYGPSPTPWFGNDDVRSQLATTQVQSQPNGQNQYQTFVQNGWQAYQGYPTFPNLNNTSQIAGFAQQQRGANLYVPPSSRPRVRVMSGTPTAQLQNQSLQQNGNYANYGYSNYGTNYGYDDYGTNYSSVAPAVMELTPSQRARFARQQRQQDHMAQFRGGNRMDPSLVSPRFSNGLDVSQQRFSTVVGPQGPQHDQTWNQMSGGAFEYPVDVYFTSGGTVAPTGE